MRTLQVSGFADVGDTFRVNDAAGRISNQTLWRVVRVIEQLPVGPGGTPSTTVLVEQVEGNVGEATLGQGTRTGRITLFDDLTDVPAAPAAPAAPTPAPTDGQSLADRVGDILTGALDFRTGFDDGAAEEDPATDGGNPRGLSLAEARRLCIEEGDLDACTIALQIENSVTLPGEGPGGLTFEDEAALQRLRGEQALEQIRAQLFPQLEASARGEAQDVTEGISTGLASSLAAIGLAAPQIFLANAQDPVGLQNALTTALGTGNAVFPTIERQQLIAEAAQSPTDIIRLLFLTGGQQPPKHRPGAFNFASVVEEGQRAREGLATEIAALPLPTFEELVDRFTPPVPPIGAAKGAVISMKRGSGVYTADHGATVVEGPELFTVGEDGTEFALLAPGSVIAPKASREEPETVDNARRAVLEMLFFGGRQPAKTKAAQDGAIINVDGATPESDLFPQTLESLLDAARAGGAALASPGRSTSDRARDLRLRLLPFEGVDNEQRQAFLDQAQGDPNLTRFLNIGLDQRARNPAVFAAEEFATQERILLGQAERELIEQGANLDELDPEKRALVIRRHAAQRNPEFFASAESALAEIDRQEQFGLGASFNQGAPGTQLPFAELLNLPAGARSAVITTLGALFGSDVVADLLELRQATRSQGFEAGTSRLFL
jgi:hypothetical protein